MYSSRCYYANVTFINDEPGLLIAEFFNLIITLRLYVKTDDGLKDIDDKFKDGLHYYIDED
jgi:hypothetical protein